MRAACIVAALVVAACTGGGASPSPSAETANVGGAPGPLALHRTNSFMEALDHGELEVTDRCTFLVKDRVRTLLAWPSDRTAWDAEDKAIVFKRLSGEIVQVRDGDQLTLGGGGSSAREDGLTGPEWARRLAWVVPPALECLVDDRWEVGDVLPPGDVSKYQ